ncbi:MAG: HAD family hydrolase [Conexivisphaera sp.]
MVILNLDPECASTFIRNHAEGCGGGHGKPIRKLVIFDLEGVLTPHEFLLELAERAGKYEEVLREFRAGINGHRSWLESLHRRIEILRGTPEEFAEEVAAGVDLEPGAAELTRALREDGWKVAVVSGGFDVVGPSLDRHGLSYDRFMSHRLVFEDGRLSDVELRFPDKGAAARRLKEEMRPDFVVAIGDGWNDVPMFSEADLAIGFRPKPVLEGYIHMGASDIDELARILLNGRLEAAAEHDLRH